ncbi:hypothetical protein R3P38DRAFT_3235531 [Favolaschia claudopus]|uniref:Uncharacterized protein n=1 Tax=Favolaschia claudopus TaxID=2862362 RepID=A0AAV9ZDZ2_9AGAR
MVSIRSLFNTISSSSSSSVSAVASGSVLSQGQLRLLIIPQSSKRPSREIRYKLRGHSRAQRANPALARLYTRAGGGGESTPAPPRPTGLRLRRSFFSFRRLWCIVIPITSVLPAALVPAALPAPPPPSTKKDKEVVAKEPPKEVPRPLPGAGLPAPLVEHLRTEVDEEVRAPEWYSITRDVSLGSLISTPSPSSPSQVSPGGARKSYESQAQALAAFNKALAWGIVQVVV